MKRLARTWPMWLGCLVPAVVASCAGSGDSAKPSASPQSTVEATSTSATTSAVPIAIADATAPDHPEEPSTATAPEESNSAADASVAQHTSKPKVAIGTVVGSHRVPGSIRVAAGFVMGFRRCYARGLTMDPLMAGTVRFKVWVSPDGEVTRVEPSGGSTLSSGVRACMVERVKLAQFPPPSAAGILEIPVTLAPSS